MAKKSSSRSAKEDEPPDDKTKKLDPQIATVIITGIVTITVAYFGFLQVIAPARETIRATQTASAIIVTQTAEKQATSLTQAVTPAGTAVPSTSTPLPSATIPPTPYCGRIISLPLSVRGNPTTVDNLPHYAKTIELQWESPPGCQIIIEFLQNQTAVYKSPEPLSSGKTDMINIPSGWTEIKAWNPQDTSGVPADDIHIILCDPATDTLCKTN